MEKIKLMMFDMDGTLLTDEKQITEPTRQILKKAKEQGILLGIATGRAKFLLERTLKEYGVDHLFDVAVALNGVMIVDLNQDEVTYTHRLTPKMTHDIADKVMKLDTNLIGYTDKKVYVRFDDEQAKRSSNMLQVPIEVYDFTQTDRDWDKLLAIRVNPFTKEEFAYLQAMDNEEYHGFETDVNSFEIVDSRISKASGIQALCEKLQISMEEVLAFGDSGNDVEMLKECGIGVCMGNGNAQAKQVADAITLSNEEDGIVAYLEQNWEILA